MVLVDKALQLLIWICTTHRRAVVLALVLGLVIQFIIRFFRKAFSKRGPNPFARDTRRAPEPLVLDQSERDRILKQGFVAKKIPDEVDAVVIGSGIGGMTCASLLAKTGKKILVLEQHDQAGGCCHTFHEKGFEFDSGIHYIGEMMSNSAIKFLIDQITDGQLLWSPLEKHYDTVAIGDMAKPKLFPIMSGREEFRNALYEKFPKEKKAIDQYIVLLKEARKNMVGLVTIKSLPKWLGNLLIRTGLVHYVTGYFKMSAKSLTHVLNELTSDKDLKAVLAYCFGDYGTLPADASFAMHATLVNHFLYGCAYPRGGASEIAFHIIRSLQKNNSTILVRANVKQILLDETTGSVKGVRVEKKSGDIDIYAPLVVSGAGFFNTYKKLLPQSVSPLKQVLSETRGIQHGIGAMSVYVGLHGTKEELGLKARNMWAFTGNDLDSICSEYLGLDGDAAGNEDIPLLFISFPSTKDPEWDKRHPGKSTCTIITLARYEWFEQWENERVMKRGADYELRKQRIGKRMWEQTCRFFPNLEDKVEYFDVGSPVSNNYYIASPRGEIYGIDHNVERFSPESAVNLRPETAIPGLYLTGQDVLSCGFAGAMFGGLFTASTILNRNLMADLMDLRKRTSAK
ncbi:predicted protein [Nematostella vectensis]|uniref:All-trans-retinol 13,14-reductase n=1 Tax=Nematostella vectensis TaxID=45351 RepID=A7RY06_NEMVE|nr:all-trans-retinol 13,14-reductase [Nematostella vectensis]EDO43555.1 predicted protein [Nematostella vectensis]|eukprot:XP_001635618.1 predicted protein [Nematostella vectensis]